MSIQGNKKNFRKIRLLLKILTFEKQYSRNDRIEMLRRYSNSKIRNNVKQRYSLSQFNYRNVYFPFLNVVGS